MVKDNPGKLVLLYRSEENRIIAGVCGGLGEYFHIDSTILRVIFILLTIFGGWGLLLYIILWILIPVKSRLDKGAFDHISQNVEELRLRTQEFATGLKNTPSENNPRFWLGMIVVFLGIFFLMGSFSLISVVDFAKIWPILLILFGLMILLRRN